MKPPTGAEKSPIHILLAYFLIYVVWGSTYYFIGVALQGLPPFLLGALRFTTAGVLLLIYCKGRGEPVFKASLIKKSAISGMVLLFIDMAVIMLAQQYVSSSLVAIIASSTAIWILALDAPMWKNNFRSLPVITGMAGGFFGVLMLYMEQFSLDRAAQSHRVYGVLLLVFGCISWALGTLYAKYHSSSEEEVNAFSGSAWQMFFAGTLFWIFTLFRGEITTMDLSAVPAVSWWALAYLILLGSILAYSAYIWLLKIHPATQVATHAYVNPFVAVFIGVTFGKEDVSWIQFSGLIIILLSVILINKKGKN